MRRHVSLYFGQILEILTLKSLAFFKTEILTHLVGDQIAG